MNVTQVDGNIILPAAPKPTEEELQKEFDYLMAESLTKKLLEKGLITIDEYDKLAQKNLETFSPFIGKVIDY